MCIYIYTHIHTYIYIYIYIYTHDYRLVANGRRWPGEASATPSDLGIHQRGVQSEGGAVDWGSII